VTFPGFAISSLMSAIAVGLIPAFVKNIFEEFAWRGHLAPRIHTLPLNDYLGHGIVGLVWGCWHIPYWLFFLSPGQIEAATAQSLPTFIPMAILGLVIASIAYGEIRLLTGSVWPAVLMHTISNALIDIQVAGGFIDIAPGMGFVVSPAHQSILSMIFFLLVGIGLHTWRIRRQPAGSDR
jgi:membrane protease YdiL (CAAX protease family)